MDMTGEQRIEAPRDVVYAALNDTEVLRQSIPGCEEIERVRDTELKAKVKLKIGPVSATFNGRVVLSDLDPPNGYRIAGEGSGGVAGFAKGHADVRLAEDGSATILTYTAKADVGGKIAQLGSRLIDSTAKRLAAEFFERFGEIVGPPPVAEAEPEAPDAPRKGWFSRMFKSSSGREAT